MSTASNRPSWEEGVEGEEILALINGDAPIIRVEAGPGTGKTFGLVRRVERLMHPSGKARPGASILVVAFNRVIQADLEANIQSRLAHFPHTGTPTVLTIHAFCLKLLGDDLRLLLPHEREAMLYDIRELNPQLKAKWRKHNELDQALRDHEAGIKVHPDLEQAVERWLVRHKASLISQLPKKLLGRLRSGDFAEQSYECIFVGEFQDLCPAEQHIFLRLLLPDGELVALGDPRQSIYAFRGNDRLGLESLALEAARLGVPILDVPISHCRRCPTRVVEVANATMALSPAEEMIAVSRIQGDIQRVHWPMLFEESVGMARAIRANIQKHPDDKHLVMVTRRKLGYRLRAQLQSLDEALMIKMDFSEGMLEEWAAREAFLYFTLMADPDASTIRSWLGYKVDETGREYKADDRNAAAYVKLLDLANDRITHDFLTQLPEKPPHRSGEGAKTLWSRIARLDELKGLIGLPQDGLDFVSRTFSAENWVSEHYDDPSDAKLDLELLRTTVQALYEEVVEQIVDPQVCLTKVARKLRYMIGTRDSFLPAVDSNLLITTLWGAKGLTAEHVYLVGVCDEALPGMRPPEYPGTDESFLEEQRRLFYVSVTRPKRTLVISQPKGAFLRDARQMGLATVGDTNQLTTCQFVLGLDHLLPESIPGANWRWPSQT